MMKKSKYIIVLILVSALVFNIILPMDTKAQANTVKEFEEEVEKYTKELEEKQNKVAKNDKEVAEIKQRISEIESEMDTIVEDIGNLEIEIEKSNQEIEEKSEESKKIIEYYQLANGENAYLEYAFGATDITDMIYRMSVVEQLTEYNDNIMTDLEELIEKNEQQKTDLSNKKESLTKLQTELEDQKERINADTAALKDAMPGIQDQIDSAKANLQYLKDLGCGENEDKDACIYRKTQSGQGGGGGSYVPNAGEYARPMVSGYVTQNWMNYGHLGIDLGNRNNPSIEVYSIATGVVFAKYYDNAGALVLKIRHNTGSGYIYSTYAHLSAWYVNVGQTVTPNTVIGRMGSTGNSSGPHLHLEITSCDWNYGGGCTWAEYQNRTLNPRSYIDFPGGLYSWWYSR